MDRFSKEELSLIYVSLSNSILYYEDVIASRENLSLEEKEYTEFLIESHLNLINRLSELLIEDTKIKKPSW